MHPTFVITCPEPANERLGILISSDWICRLVPYFHTDAEIAPNFAKISRCPHLAPCRNRTAQRLKTGNYSFERGIIALHLAGKNAQVFLYLFSRKSGELVVQVSFNGVARFTIVRQMAPRVPSVLSAAMENDAVAAV